MSKTKVKTSRKNKAFSGEIDISGKTEPEIIGMMAAMYSSPLPPPEHLERYERLAPGAAERILRLAEKQQDHSHKLKLESLEFDKRSLTYFSKGQIIAALLAFGLLFAVYILAMANHDSVASIVGGSTILGLTATFVLGISSKNKN